MALSINKQRFVAVLLTQKTFNATKAYEEVFTARGQSASTAACMLMNDPEVAAAVAEGQAARLKRLELTADDVLRDVALGVTSSGGELAEHVLDSCRYCHGYKHLYQSTPAEYARNLADYLANDAARKGKGPRDPMGLLFDARGGVGYDPRKPPVDDCPECFGRGIGRIIPKDTRYLSEHGRRQYAGVKMTKQGPELQMRSRDKALEIAAKHTGVAKDHIKLETVRDLTDEQLAAKTAALEAKLKAAK